MKKLSKITVFVLAFALALFTFVACKNDPKVTIELDKNQAELTVGGTVQLTATTESKEAVVWSSSDENVATVDGGLVTAVAQGTVTITATVEGVSASCTVTVKEATPQSSLTLDKTTANMDLYESLTLTATKHNLEGDVTWSSSDPAKATVENGVVTALKEGEVTITATVGSVSATCVVKITSSGQIPMLSVNRENVVIKTGQSITVVPTMKYKNKTVEATYEWSTSDHTKATVENGVITGVAYGADPVIVTVKASYNGFVATKTITVTVTDNVTFTLNKNSVNLAVSTPPGTDYIVSDTITASVIDNNETISNPTIEWSSENEKVATVENGTITAVGVGSTVVNAVYTSKANIPFRLTVQVNVELPVVELAGRQVIDLNADEKSTVSVDLNGSGISADEVDKVAELVNGVVSSPVDFTVSGTSLVFNKDDLRTGEKVFRIETDLAAYVSDVIIATKIFYTAKDIDNMWKYAAADKDTVVMLDKAELTQEQINSVNGGDWGTIDQFGGKVYKYGGYYMLGNNIQYNKTIVGWCERYAFGNFDANYPGLDFSPNDVTNIGFHGTFNGDGYAIYGMTTAAANSGFVGTLGTGGVIKNVSFINAKAVANSGIVSSVNAGTIENVYVQGTTAGGNAGWGYAGALAGKCSATTKFINVVLDVTVGLGDNNSLVAGGGASGMIVENVIAIGSKGGENAPLFVKDAQGESNIKYYKNIDEVIADTEKDYSAFSFEGSVWDIEGNLPVMINTYKDLVKITNEGEVSLYKGESYQVYCTDNNVIYSLVGEPEGFTISDTGLLTVPAETDVTSVTVRATSKISPSFYDDFTISIKNVSLIDSTSVVSAEWSLESAEDYVLKIDGFTGNVDNVSCDGEDIAGVTASGETFTFPNEAVKALGYGEKVLEITSGNNLYRVKVINVTKEISTPKDLAALESFVIDNGDGTVGGYFTLGGNIDMENAEVAGVGSSSDGVNWGNKWVGTFDGKGYTISNMKVTETYGGLFSYIAEGGVVKNVAFINAEVATVKGAIIATQCDGEISNVFMNGKITATAGNGNNPYPVALVVSQIGNNAAIQNIFAVSDSWSYDGLFGGMIIANADAAKWRDLGYANVKNLYSVDAYGADTWVWNTAYSAVGNNYSGKGVNNPTSEDNQALTDTDEMIRAGIINQSQDFHVKSWYNYGQMNTWLAEDNEIVGLDGEYWTTIDGGKLPIFESAKEAMLAKINVETLHAVSSERSEAVAGEQLELISSVSSFHPTFTLKEEVDGVTLENNILTIDEGVAHGTEIVIVGNSDLFGKVNVESTVTVTNLEVVDKTETLLDYVDINGESDTVLTIEGLTEAVDRIVYDSTVIEVKSTEGENVTVEANKFNVLPVGEESIISIITGTKMYRVKLFAVSKIITKKSHMASLENYVKDNGDGTVYGYFIVGADIDMENSNIAGVGSYNNGWIKKFSGTFDGQGHTISNFTINESNGGILSCMVEGSVFKNVSLINVINRSQSGLVVTELNGTVSNVFVQGQLLGGSANWAPGSLLVSKMADTGKIENCVVVVENFDDSLTCGGALIGKFGGASKDISNSVAVILSPGTLYAVGAHEGKNINGAEGIASVKTFIGADAYTEWRSGGDYNAEVDGWLWDDTDGESVIGKWLADTTVITTEAQEISRGGSLQLTSKASQVNWSIQDEVEGVTISETGLVEVDLSAVGNTEFTVVLTNKFDTSITDEVTFTVGKYEEVSLGSESVGTLVRDDSTADQTLTIESVTGNVESVYVNGQEVSITADGNSVTFADSVVETFTSGNLPVSIYTEDKVYTAVISVKKVISTPKEFAALESFVTVKGGNADGYIELGANIDMENAAVAGVGSSSDGFNWVNKWIGTFDGKGYTISNMKVTETFGGLFSYIAEGGVVKNVAFVGADVAMSKGALIASQCDGEISNVFVKGKISATAGNGNNPYPVALVVSQIGNNAAIQNIFAVSDSWSYDGLFGGMIIANADAAKWRDLGYANVKNLYSVDAYGADTWVWNTAYSAVGNNYSGKGVNNPTSDDLNSVTDTDEMIRVGLLTEEKDFHVKSWYNYGQFEAWIAEESNAIVGLDGEYWTTTEKGYPVFVSCKDLVQLGTEA